MEISVARQWAYGAHLAAAVAGGLAAYAVLLAAHEAMAYPGDVLSALLFFLAVETGFAIVWRRRTEPNSRAMPGALYALALTIAAIFCGLVGLRGAYLGMSLVQEEGAPLIIPFLAEVTGYLVGFALPMAPASWLIWRRLGQRA